MKNGTREKVSKAFDRVASVSFFMASKFSGFNILLKERLVKSKNFLALQSRPSIRINVWEFIKHNLHLGGVLNTYISEYIMAKLIEENGSPLLTMIMGS